MDSTKERMAQVCRQDDADDLLTRHFAGAPAPGGGQVVEVITWGVEGAWFYRGDDLDLMVGYVDRSRTHSRERNPPWHPSVKPEQLRRWFSKDRRIPREVVRLWLEPDF
jgi:hypothetical protein